MLIGMEIIKIMMLARWSSPVITHYARLAPLKNLADDFKRRIVDKEASKKGTARATTTKKLARDEVDITRVSAILSKQVKTMKEELESLHKALAEMKEQRRPPAYAPAAALGEGSPTDTRTRRSRRRRSSRRDADESHPLSDVWDS